MLQRPASFTNSGISRLLVRPPVRLASAVVGVLNEMCSVRAPSLRCALSSALKCCLRLPGAVDRCLFLLCRVQLTKPTASDSSEDDAAALKACARLFSTNLRRDSLGSASCSAARPVLPSRASSTSRASCGRGIRRNPGGGRAGRARIGRRGEGPWPATLACHPRREEVPNGGAGWGKRKGSGS